MEFGLIGEKLSHSYSKEVHRALCNYDYELFSIPPEDFNNFITKSNYKGLNVTIPYKKAILPFCKGFSPLATEIGSVNTVIKNADGSLTGYNTDYFGFLYMAHRIGISFKDKKVLILGTGGTSLTVRTAVRNEGAREIIIASRKGPVNYDEIKKHQDIDIIINATPVGMYPNNGETLIDLDDFPHCFGVLDVIYNPLCTQLVLDAKAKGIKASGGLPMLIAQAVKAAEIFSGKAIPPSRIEAVLHQIQTSVENIVLIGMPGCGKTTIGTEVANLLGRKLYDTDLMIVKENGVSISEIFEKSGEKSFRNMEAQKTKEVSKGRGCVIATGGGTVLRRSNCMALAGNGRIYFLERNIADLVMDGRPLSCNAEALKTMYEQRYPLYKKYADAIVKNNTDIGTVAYRVLNDFNQNPSH